jgi:hypothetical protein
MSDEGTVYGASMRDLRRDLVSRQNRVTESLGVLQNQTSEYAQDHRSYLVVLAALISVVDSHMPYTGPARDGIEAQHGLNDVYPGDEYP